MRNLFRIAFFIPRLIIGTIWSSFWAIFRTVVVIGIVCFGLLCYANNNSSQLANTISAIADNITSYFSTNSDNTANSLKDSSMDDFTHYSGARWLSNSANVYIKTTSEMLIEAYEEAISAWDATGAFTFGLVSNGSSADIIATDYSDASSKAAGLAGTKTNAPTNRITYVDVGSNTYYLAESDHGYMHNHIAYTAEHELRHAIGPDHDDNKQFVMQSSESYYGIQDVSIQKVQEPYAS